MKGTCRKVKTVKMRYASNQRWLRRHPDRNLDDRAIMKSVRSGWDGYYLGEQRARRAFFFGN